MQLDAAGTAIEVDDQGPREGEPLLLIMGLGMQLVAWPQELVDALVGHGFRVIRFDNRDAGLSQGFDERGTPALGGLVLRQLLHLPARPAYRLADMARDAQGVLDALGLPAAHVCGASMGGMVAQHLAASAPRRVKSLTLMLTASGAPGLPWPRWRALGAALSPHGPDFASRRARYERLFRAIGSPAYPAPPEWLRRQVEAGLRRAYHPHGTARQFAAVVADGDRTALLSRIQAPAHIIHGADDPLVPLPAPYDLQAKIPGATVEVIAGMGHDLPLALLPRFAASIAALARRGGALSPAAAAPAPA